MSEDFEQSYLGQLRKLIGNRLVLMPGARCVIEDEAGRVLLQLRGDMHVWGLPAGFCEAGESVATTLVREVAEETGLTVLDPVPWGHASDPDSNTLTYPNGDMIQGFGLDFVARKWEGELHADGEETLALDWFGLDDLPEMLPSHRLTLDYFRRYRETGAFQLF
ncbi:NUDIX domain-containing protein [Nisaea acidiphila]|uniref:NUDIX domain-containing protein n=1 Tax=Nisaea acidiphila TaxID=1862145 RepID=A0A9J7B0L6_9PROT|nr:NUDIX domain-containing protein [Nisaea acidiphila]UUX51229.1 NUDIX domain-containing protein [Nisaea acidiphila]